ncbi:hypothetical protein LY76DRAFT_588689 [Colletotrichum caudatum]|nr:hypothetical protein LY76DRAFT_588689 [Colletotrichum caudatum]
MTPGPIRSDKRSAQTGTRFPRPISPAPFPENNSRRPQRPSPSPFGLGRSPTHTYRHTVHARQPPEQGGPLDRAYIRYARHVRKAGDP